MPRQRGGLAFSGKDRPHCFYLFIGFSQEEDGDAWREISACRKEGRSAFEREGGRWAREGLWSSHLTHRGLCLRKLSYSLLSKSRLPYWLLVLVWTSTYVVSNRSLHHWKVIVCWHCEFHVCMMGSYRCFGTIERRLNPTYISAFCCIFMSARVWI